jgi:hypothetical protein
MLVSSFKLIRKLLVLALLLSGLAVAGLNQGQPVKAQQCCSFCEVMDEACQNWCEFHPDTVHCHACPAQVVNCFQGCDPGC